MRHHLWAMSHGLLISRRHALLAGLALPPLGMPPLLWLALVPLWALAGSALGAWGGALWGAAAVLVSHRWLLGLHPLDWIGVPGPLSLPLALLLLLLCALAGALLVALWVLLARRLDPRRFSSALLLAAGWGLVEVLLAKGPLFWLGLGAADSYQQLQGSLDLPSPVYLHLVCLALHSS